MLNVVLPIAGRGSRFQEAGYSIPKPLIPIHGVPMIEVILKNIRPLEKHRLIFVAQEEHLRLAGMSETLRRIEPEAEVFSVPSLTEGAACTVLTARDLINTDEPLMIANSDQWVECEINKYLSEMDRQGADGLIMTMWADHAKWSYARLDASGQVIEVAEKAVVSNNATVGIYNFRRGSDFVHGAERMIVKNTRVNNEFYVAPVYNQMIACGAKVITFNVGHVGDGMWGIGTPEDLEAFLKDPVSEKAVLGSSRIPW